MAAAGCPWHRTQYSSRHSSLHACCETNCQVTSGLHQQCVSGCLPGSPPVGRQLSTLFVQRRVCWLWQAVLFHIAGLCVCRSAITTCCPCCRGCSGVGSIRSAGVHRGLGVLCTAMLQRALPQGTLLLLLRVCLALAAAATIFTRWPCIHAAAASGAASCSRQDWILGRIVRGRRQRDGGKALRIHAGHAGTCVHCGWVSHGTQPMSASPGALLAHEQQSAKGLLDTQLLSVRRCRPWKPAASAAAMRCCIARSSAAAAARSRRAAASSAALGPSSGPWARRPITLPATCRRKDQSSSATGYLRVLHTPGGGVQTPMALPISCATFDPCGSNKGLAAVPFQAVSLHQCTLCVHAHPLPTLCRTVSSQCQSEVIDLHMLMHDNHSPPEQRARPLRRRRDQRLRQLHPHNLVQTGWLHA